MSVESRLAELGIALPKRPRPVARFMSWKQVDNTLYLSGQGPRNDDGTVRVGRLGESRTIEQGIDDARQIGLQILATIRDGAGSLDRVESIVKLLGFVNATPDFTEHPKIIDGCSDLLIDVLGPDRGPHARTAIGVQSLPGGMPVEIEAIVQLTGN